MNNNFFEIKRSNDDDDLIKLMFLIIDRSHQDFRDCIEEFANTCEEDIHKKPKIFTYIQGVALYAVEMLIDVLGAERAENFLKVAMLDIIEHKINQGETNE